MPKEEPARRTMMQRIFTMILLLGATVFLSRCRESVAQEMKRGDVLLIDANPTDEDAGGILPLSDVKASSFLKDKSDPDPIKNPYKGMYVPFKSVDGKTDTAWVEGVPGPGIGQWIQFDFQYPLNRPLNRTNPYPHNSPAYYKQMEIVYRIGIINGCAKNKEIYYANNRVKRLQLSFSEGEKRTVDLKDGVLGFQIFKTGRIPSKWVKMTIEDVYKGSKYDDTCISEVFFEEDNYGFFRPGGWYEDAKCKRCD